MTQPQFPSRYQRTAEYAAIPSAAGAARRETVQTLKDWGLLAAIDTAELLVSELISNAVKATGVLAERPRYTELQDVQKVLLQLRLESERLLILVWDGDPRPPVVKDADEESEGGRGLRLVGALSRRWGYYPAGRGKVIWCELGAQHP
jgi:anti-sigma regulatory factor (Ser/Thr protein kinase)